MEMPNPAPNSNSCDVNNCWRIQGVSAAPSVSNNNEGNGTNGGTGVVSSGVNPNANPAMFGVVTNQPANNSTIKPTIMPPLAQ